MSWVSRMVEERLAAAARDGELDAGPLTGKPIPGIDEHRPDGWWAERFVRRELSHDRRKVAVAASAAARVEFWRADTPDEVVALVRRANAALDAANVNLTDADRVERFDEQDVLATWASLRRPRPG